MQKIFKRKSNTWGDLQCSNGDNTDGWTTSLLFDKTFKEKVKC